MPPLVPTIRHEAPLVLFRHEPEVVPRVLAELLGVPVPRFDRAEVLDADFTQALATEYRADLVICLRGEAPDDAPRMAIVVEVQLARDDHKRWTWPLYLAALRARQRCPTALVVVALDESVARWAATPVHDLHPGCQLVPLVVGPAQIPRVDLARAQREPWLATLSALAHGNRPDGGEVTLAAFRALTGAADRHAMVFAELIFASLNDAARKALEAAMLKGTYEFQTDFFRRLAAEGRAHGYAEGHAEGHAEGRVLEARALLRELVESSAGRARRRERRRDHVVRRPRPTARPGPRCLDRRQPRRRPLAARIVAGAALIVRNAPRDRA